MPPRAPGSAAPPAAAPPPAPPISPLSIVPAAAAGSGGQRDSKVGAALRDRRREPAAAVAAAQVGPQLAASQAPAVAVGDRPADLLTFHRSALLALAQCGPGLEDRLSGAGLASRRAPLRSRA